MSSNAPLLLIGAGLGLLALSAKLSADQTKASGEQLKPTLEALKSIPQISLPQDETAQTVKALAGVLQESGGKLEFISPDFHIAVDTSVPKVEAPAASPGLMDWQNNPVPTTAYEIPGNGFIPGLPIPARTYYDTVTGKMFYVRMTFP